MLGFRDDEYTTAKFAAGRRCRARIHCRVDIGERCIPLIVPREAQRAARFFPLAFTGTCSKELICFTEDFDQFAGKGVEILPISVDSTPSLKEFKNKLQMKTELLSDFKREISRAYGVLNEERFFSNRAYFLIDKEGRVRWSHVEGNNSERRENSEILAAIKPLS